MCAKHNFKVHSYGGATTEDMSDLLRVGMRRKPDVVIIHSGSNDLTRNPPVNTEVELDNAIKLIRDAKADTEIAFSLLVERNDKHKHLNPKIKELNNNLKSFCAQRGVSVIEHDRFDHTSLAIVRNGPRGQYGGLHPNTKGNAILAKDFRNFVEC